MKRAYWKSDYQSHDNGKSWRIIREWEFKRQSDNTIALAGMYANKRNFWVHATLKNGEIVWDNPRQVSIPNYAREIVAQMLAQ